jgi:ribosome-associated protein
MIEITPQIHLDPSELRVSFIRASGPGGQNVNKVATAVQLRFDAASSPSLPETVRLRLLRLAGSRATADGEIVIEAKRFRTQARNREDAQERLVALIRRAATLPKPRRKTRASAGVKARALESKRKRGEVKRRRRPVQGTDE